MNNLREIKKLILDIDIGLHILDEILLDTYISNSPIKTILYSNNKKLIDEAIINLILYIKEYNKKNLITKIKSKNNENELKLLKLVDMCKKYKINYKLAI